MRSRMKVEEKRLEEIRPYENNPRVNSAAVPAVAKSIEEYGWQQPILVDRNNVIIVGHTRYEAAKQLGLKTVPVVVETDMTEEQIRAYRLADNKTAELRAMGFKEVGADIFGDVDSGNYKPEEHDNAYTVVTLCFQPADYDYVQNVIQQRGREYVTARLVRMCGEI